jgi:hypothetical protein
MASALMLMSNISVDDSWAHKRKVRVIDRLIDRMPLCRENLKSVTIKNLGGYDHEGYITLGRAKKGHIEINSNTSYWDLPYTVAHECGHIVDFATRGMDKLKNKKFGHPPYVSEYAKTDTYEDFADSYAFHFLYQKGDREKRVSINKITQR